MNTRRLKKIDHAFWLLQQAADLLVPLREAEREDHPDNHAALDAAIYDIMGGAGVLEEIMEKHGYQTIHP